MEILKWRHFYDSLIIMNSTALVIECSGEIMFGSESSQSLQNSTLKSRLSNTRMDGRKDVTSVKLMDTFTSSLENYKYLVIFPDMSCKLFQSLRTMADDISASYATLSRRLSGESQILYKNHATGYKFLITRTVAIFGEACVSEGGE